MNGPYSIANCIKVLTNIRQSQKLTTTEYGYALELLKDSQNRVMVVSSKDSLYDLELWIKYKYEKELKAKVVHRSTIATPTQTARLKF
ncbi:hypothetical protein P8452_41398 [Trifolium repens]|nr:hypothetical protein QL285_025477 [Trifolium repens]WJX55654.1 hypothetical protein P8452_41398 [Trifolium repens]